MYINLQKKVMMLGLSFYFIHNDAKELLMNIIIPSYNNEKWCKKNIESALSQDYDNFKIYFIDDCSSDKTFEIVRDIVEKSGLKNKCVLIKNNQNYGALHNFYHVIHGCDDQSIIVQLDGDDWLAHKNVLKELHKIYNSNNIWLTYGQFKLYPDNIVGWCKPLSDKIIKNNTIRKAPWVTSHLRTFKAKLFKGIKLEDLLYEGKFYSMAPDLAMMFPMIEMAGEHIYCFREVLYIYNNSNPLSEHRVKHELQKKLASFIRKQKTYKRLDRL